MDGAVDRSTDKVGGWIGTAARIKTVGRMGIA